MDIKVSHSHTDEQLDILNAVAMSKDNIMIEALAGTGKTTTLEALEKVAVKPSLYLCFNKKNALEATDRMPSTTMVKTFNSIGLKVWKESRGKEMKLNVRKTGDIFKALVDELPKAQRSSAWEVYSEVRSGVDLAKALGYVPDSWQAGNPKRIISQSQLHHFLDEKPDDLTSDLIDGVLHRSIKASFDGLIDFNDQVYMPALWGGSFPKYPLVLVDEYQDLSPTNHALLERLVKGRIIGVGDPYQNIYGFRGAKAGGMHQAIAHYSMSVFPLSISFRCPSAIVNHVRWRVPQFRSFRDGGSVHALEKLDGGLLRDNSTIICRNNAPLFSLAFRLLSNGRGVSVAGTDIGPKLVAILRKLGDEDLSAPAALDAIDLWEADKLDRESRTAHDMAECMRVFVRQSSTLGTAVTYAEHVLKQEGSIKLMTGHKSKGLEFEDVIHIDKFLLGATEQDRNLEYVISTRSFDRLTEVPSSEIAL